MKRSFLLLYIFSGLVIISAYFPANYAQAVDASSILVNLAPQNPGPGENTTISLNSYASNLDSVNITWSVDGKTAASGIGKKSFSLSAPAAGTETDIVATVDLPEGSLQTKIVLRPLVMTLLWQSDSDSYVPPFYKGKAMPTPGSNIKVVAIPEVKNKGIQVNPKNMVYSWQKDYTNDQTASGYGKSFYKYANDYLEGKNNVSVTVSSTDQKFSSEANLDISTVAPKIDFYRQDQNLGTLWEQALGADHTVAGDEIIVAAPYFISPEDIRVPSLIFYWSLNGDRVGSQGTAKNIFPVQAQAGTSGVAELGLEIDNKYKLFETAVGSLNLHF